MSALGWAACGLWAVLAISYYALIAIRSEHQTRNLSRIEALRRLLGEPPDV